MPKTKLYSYKQAILLPRLEMEKYLYIVGMDHARSSLRRQEEEGAIWQELYDNHRMLKSSVSSRFTWADILHGVVDVLPPRDYSDDVTDSGGGGAVSKAEVNRRFMEFRSQKSREILGTRAPKRPSYRDLYKDECGRKETNQRSFDALVRRHKLEKEELIRAQGMYTPLLPIINEETHALRHDDATLPADDDDMTSARSLPAPAKTPISQFNSPVDCTASSNRNSCSDKDCVTSSSLARKRKRKVGSVISKHDGLYLAKARPSDEGISKDNRFLTGRNSKRDDLSHFSKLPPILSCSTENLNSDRRAVGR